MQHKESRDNDENYMKPKSTALLRFDHNGELESIFLNCDSDAGQEILHRALKRLIQPSLWNRVARFFPQNKQ